MSQEHWNPKKDCPDFSTHPLTETLCSLPERLPPLSWEAFREVLQTDPYTAIHAVGSLHFLDTVSHHPLFIPYNAYIESEDMLPRAIVFHDIGKAGVAETMEKSAKIVGEPGSEAAKTVRGLHPWIGGWVARFCQLSPPEQDIIFGHHEGIGLGKSYPRNASDRSYEDSTVPKVLVQIVERTEACIGIRPYQGDARENDPRVRLMDVREMLSGILHPWAIAPAFPSLEQATEFCQNMTTILCEVVEAMHRTSGLYDPRIFRFWQKEFAPDVPPYRWILPLMMREIRERNRDRLAISSQTS